MSRKVRVVVEVEVGDKSHLDERTFARVIRVAIDRFGTLHFKGVNYSTNRMKVKEFARVVEYEFRPERKQKDLESGTAGYKMLMLDAKYTKFQAMAASINTLREELPRARVIHIEAQREEAMDGRWVVTLVYDNRG